jgi:hypothetical protein
MNHLQFKNNQNSEIFQKQNNNINANISLLSFEVNRNYKNLMVHFKSEKYSLHGHSIAILWVGEKTFQWERKSTCKVSESVKTIQISETEEKS